jgi:hypothetical protein
MYHSPLFLSQHERYLNVRKFPFTEFSPASAKVIIEGAILAGELPNDSNADALLDALYGGLYYWLFIDHEVLTEAYVDSIFATVLGPLSHTAQSKRFTRNRRNKS